MNNIQIFENKEFGKVRTVEINGEAWFVGKDVAVILGYSNTRDALARHVDDEDKNTVVIPDGNKGNPNQTIINESGLYSLILSSKLPNAKRFKHWVTSEVLPAIRKTGAYAAEISLVPDVLGTAVSEMLSVERAKVYTEVIRHNIGYDDFFEWADISDMKMGYDKLDEIVGIIVGVLNDPNPYMVVFGDVYLREKVKPAMLSADGETVVKTLNILHEFGKLRSYERSFINVLYNEMKKKMC